jgi:hypothetical protein
LKLAKKLWPLAKMFQKRETKLSAKSEFLLDMVVIDRCLQHVVVEFKNMTKSDFRVISGFQKLKIGIHIPKNQFWNPKNLGIQKLFRFLKST